MRRAAAPRSRRRTAAMQLEIVQPLIFDASAPGPSRRAVSRSLGGCARRLPPASRRFPADQRRSTRPAPAGSERAGPAAPLQPAVAPEPRHRPGLLPARLVHHEVQPQGQRMGGAPARPGRLAPARSRRAGPGQPGAGVAAGRAAEGDLRPGGGQPAAGGRGAGRADRHAHDPRLPSVPRRGRAAHQGAGARQRARHQSGDRQHGRLPDRDDPLQRARRDRPRGAARGTLARTRRR